LVSIGTDHDTAAFAVATLRRWWQSMGKALYPRPPGCWSPRTRADPTATRVRAWKTELARFAAETGLEVTVCHFLAGTSKWNRIEHRLFSAISMNGRGRPLESHEVIVELIGATRTRTPLRVRAELDRGRYPLGLKLRGKQPAAVPVRPARVNLCKAGFLWNHCVVAGPPLAR
jgi:hypothetical protein